MTVPYKKHRPLSIMHEAAQKITYMIRDNRTFYHHETQLTTRADRSYHVQTKSGSSHLNYGSLTSWSPSPSGVKIRSNPALIFKTNGSSKLLGPFLYLRQIGSLLMINSFFILLICTIQRLLTGKSQLSEQPSHRAFTQFDAKLPVNGNRNHRLLAEANLPSSPPSTG